MFNFDFNIYPNFASGLYEIRLRQELNGRVFRADNLIFKEIEPGEMIPKFMELDKESAQALMNSLYRAGIRPTETFDQSSQLESVKYHLEDMRKLVFQK